MTIVEHIATAADLERLPDDGFRYELVCGEVRKMTPAGNEHGKIAALVTASLGYSMCWPTNWVRSMRRKRGSGWRRTRIRCGHRMRPLCAKRGWMRLARWRVIGRERPIWLVEVVSPGDRYGEVAEKVADWLAAGTQMVVVVEPQQRTVAVHRLRTVLWMY